MSKSEHKLINWVDGMKLNSRHFIMHDNALLQSFSNAYRFTINKFNYGLLSGLYDEGDPLDIFYNYEQANKRIIARVLRCKAITPGGVRIDFDYRSLDDTSNTQNIPEIEIALDGFDSLGYDLVLVANPYKRNPTGIPNPEESPLRVPFVDQELMLQALPVPREDTSLNGPNYLTLARIELEGKKPKLSKKYIPPYTTISGSSVLTSLNNRIQKKLQELESTLINIVQKKRSAGGSSKLDLETIYLCEKLLDFLLHSRAGYNVNSSVSPPVEMVTYCLTINRILYATLETSPLKMDMLDHYCNWVEWSPGKFENTLSDILKLSYNHEDSFETLKQVEEVYEMILNFYKQIWRLCAPGEVSNKKRKQLGWLVEHSRGKNLDEMHVFVLDEEAKIIGRGTDATVQCKIVDDQFISRKHAKLEVDNDSFLITDLQSRYGTLIQSQSNGWMKLDDSGYYLMDGDFIQFGKTVFVLKTVAEVSDTNGALKAVSEMPFPKLYQFEFSNQL